MLLSPHVGYGVPSRCAWIPAVANVVSPIVGDFLHRRGTLRLNRFLGLGLLMQASFFIVLGCLSAGYGHNGNSHDLQRLYGVMIALAGFGYGVFLTMFPPTLADAYGYANFGSVVVVVFFCR